MTNEVSRPEFDGAIESLRREIKAMSDNVGRELSRLTKQMEDFLSTRMAEAKALGELQADMKNLQEWKAGAISAIRTLQIGLIITVAGAILTGLITLALRSGR